MWFEGIMIQSTWETIVSIGSFLDNLTVIIQWTDKTTASLAGIKLLGLSGPKLMRPTAVNDLYPLLPAQRRAGVTAGDLI